MNVDIGPRRPWSARAGAGIRLAFALALLIVGCGGGGGGEEGADGSAGTTGDGMSSADSPGVRAVTAGAPGSPFGFGEPVREEDVDPWDIDVGPDGEGLPPGSGTVPGGAAVYETSCARCHGPNAVDGPYGPLVATEGAESFPFGRDPSLTTSIGNYWPYATTVFDYVRRSMPFDDPGSLTDEEVYAVTAWLLWRNGLVAEDAVMSAETLPAVEMPAREHFVPSEDVSLTSLP